MLLIIITASACSQMLPGASAIPSETPVSEEQLHQVFVTPLIDNPVWKAAKNGYDDASRDFNFRGDWVGPSAIDGDEMIKQIKIAIAEKADGIITQGTNPRPWCLFFIHGLEDCIRDGEIEVHAEETEERIKISISDNGKGMTR